MDDGTDPAKIARSVRHGLESVVAAKQDARIAALEAERAKWIAVHDNHAAINARQAERIEALEAQLAEAERTIERLRAEFDKRESRCQRWCMGYPAEHVRQWVAREVLDAAEAERDEARERNESLQQVLDFEREQYRKTLTNYSEALGERDEARRVAVESVRRGLRFNSRDIEFRETDGNQTFRRREVHDGTNESIYAALREAMGESE